MAWVEKFIRQATGKGNDIGFPETGSVLQEQKRATIFKERERMVEKRLNVRFKQNLSFKRFNPKIQIQLDFLKDKLTEEEYQDTLDKLGIREEFTTEESLVENVISQTILHSAAFHGIGSRHPVTSENMLGYFRLAKQLRSFQREYGADDMLVQCLFQRFLTCDQSVGFRSFTEEDLGVSAVTIPLESPDLFKGLESFLPEREKKTEKETE